MDHPQGSLPAALRRHRAALALELLESLRGWDKFADGLNSSGEERHEWVRRELFAFVDYLALYLERRDADFRNLYIGEKLKQCYDARDSAEEAAGRRRRVTEADRAAFERVLGAALPPAEMAALLRELDSIHGVVTAEGRQRARVLFVGDCLHLDVVAFLTAPLLEDGLTLEPVFATSKNPVELHKMLRGLEGTAFDLVFYSPITYNFQPDFAQLERVRTTLRGGKTLRAIADAAIGDATGTIRLLGELFEAPVFVHNTANLRRHDGSLRERTKTLATQRVRHRARRLFNAWLPDFLEQMNEAGVRRFFLMDEMAMLRGQREDRLSNYLYDTMLQHPAVFSKVVAAEYRTAISAQVRLEKKKLIVCDLDNTLWEGVIGEGAVRHYADRQQTLLALRKKGMVLAVNSKNDPQKVHWTGAVLGPEDFVSMQINWENKVQNLRRIAQELNLKTKDFVFVDDRADERSMVNELMPEVLTLDATAEESWRELNLLSRMLPEQTEMDRTLAYRQREQREKFLGSEQEAAVDEKELFRRLELKVELRPAGAKELARVAELINRTNQFNMRGSRTTPRQIAGWSEDPGYAVIVAEAGDRFGSMGVVSALVLELGEQTVEIAIFVLSCRVFGYGVETAILNYVKRIAGERVVTGTLTHTPHNEPCRKVYAENGFKQDGERWSFAGVPAESDALCDPEWLRVTAAYPPEAAAGLKYRG